MHCLATTLFLFYTWSFVRANGGDAQILQLPTDDCWPAPEAWNQLNTTLNDRLLHPKPPASVCYPEEPNFDEEACQRVRDEWTSSAWHGNDPISLTAPPIDGCHPIYPNGTSISGDPLAGERGCVSSSYPAYVVNASSIGDVQAGINFAREHSLRLNVKSTGHGKSSIPGSLSIWTHHFREKHFHEKFSPHGSNSTINDTQMAITFGAGVMDQEAFEFAAEYDAAVVGGTDSTVGLVGWGAAGGHGYLTAKYGMGADSFLQATVVTPSGNVIVANEHQNADVFWAMRGGGAGTWGVIVSVTLKAFPMPSTTFFSLTLSAQNGSSASNFYEAVAHVLADYPRLRQNGVSGYITISGAPLIMTNALFVYDEPGSKIESLTKPLTNWLAARNSTVSVTAQAAPTIPRWIDFFHQFNLTESVGGGSTALSASRLLPTKSLTDVDSIAEFLEVHGPSPNEPETKLRSGRSISGTATGSLKPVDNGLNPAWREAIVHMIVNESYEPRTPAKLADEITAEMRETAYEMRKLAPDSGAYINERGDFVPDWQKTLYGEHYSRLLAIKHEIDPEGVQWCDLCVASDEWYTREDGRFCKRSWA